MSALREIANARQIEGEPRRRWFSSTELDLIVWLGDGDTPVGFQLCYDKPLIERAITWRKGRGFDHAAVDTGEHSPMRHKSTPILVADGPFDVSRVATAFDDASGAVPEPIRRYVSERLARYPEG